MALARGFQGGHGVGEIARELPEAGDAYPERGDAEGPGAGQGAVLLGEEGELLADGGGGALGALERRRRVARELRQHGVDGVYLALDGGGARVEVVQVGGRVARLEVDLGEVGVVHRRGLVHQNGCRGWHSGWRAVAGGRGWEDGWE